MATTTIDFAEKTQDGTYSTNPKEMQTSESDVEQGTTDIYVVDKKLERQLLWKFDLHILPMLAIMYLFK
jgi:acetyl-CoA carboxylase beta subunit